MEALVKKLGKVIGYSIHKDVLYLSFSVPLDSFTGDYANLVAFPIPGDDIKSVIAALKGDTYELAIYFRGSIIQNIDFRYQPKSERSFA